MLTIKNIQWVGESETGHLRLLDQTLLPSETHYLECDSVQSVWDAIKRLRVRGAPAIGIAAAYGCVLAVQGSDDAVVALRDAAKHLAGSRPTAVNLFWALSRMQRVAPCSSDAMLGEATAIHREDAAMCQKIGEYAVGLVERHAFDAAVLTHCNAGALATGGIGTATAPLYLTHGRGLPLHVYADETRPLLQGSRLTAFELAAAGIDVTVICDGTAAHVMQLGKVGMVITGADRIAANGDTANKIGTYNLAVLARHHDIPFYVAAPSSTFDLSIADGSQIPIELRGGEEITEGFGRRIAPDGIETYCPAFDVTPHELIAAIVTERGLIEPVDALNVARVLPRSVV